MSELNSLSHGLYLLSLTQRLVSLYQTASVASGLAAEAYQEILANPQLRNCLKGVPLDWEGGLINVALIDAYYTPPYSITVVHDSNITSFRTERPKNKRIKFDGFLTSVFQEVVPGTLHNEP